MSLLRNKFLSAFVCLNFLTSLPLPCHAVAFNFPAPEQQNADQVLANILQIATTAHQQGTLDGEFIYIRNGKTTHLISKETLPNYNTTSAKPQYVVGKQILDEFIMVALLKTLYLSTTAPTEKSKVDEVKLICNQPISKFLPPTHPLWGIKMPSWAKEVTLYHVIIGNSGIANYDDEKQFQSPQEIIQSIANEPPLAPPGAEFNASNVNAILIKEILLTMAKQPLATYLQNNLFAPAGMTATAILTHNASDSPQKNPFFNKLAPTFQYTIQNDNVIPQPWPKGKEEAILESVESAVSTLSDLVTWITALHKNKLILPPQLYTFFTTQNNEMGALFFSAINLPSTIGNLIPLGYEDEKSYSVSTIYLPQHDAIVAYGCNTSMSIPQVTIWHRNNPDVDETEEVQASTVVLPSSEAELDEFISAIDAVLRSRKLQRGFPFLSRTLFWNPLLDVQEIENDNDWAVETTPVLIEIRKKAEAAKKELLLNGTIPDTPSGSMQTSKRSIHIF
jgi:hypothetical protein